MRHLKQIEIEIEILTDGDFCYDYNDGHCPELEQTVERCKWFDKPLNCDSFTTKLERCAECYEEFPDEGTDKIDKQ